MIKSGKIGMRSDGDYDYKIFVIICDRCKKVFRNQQQDYSEGFSSFQEAVNAKRLLGIRSVKAPTGWIELCPACYEKTIEGSRRRNT